MNGLNHYELTSLFLALAVLLGTARVFGEIATRFRQPAILGEIMAGIVLGPTVFGAILPAWSEVIFPLDGNMPLALHGFTTISITLFLLVAGMEVDLSTILRRGHAAFHVGVTGMIPPFALGFAMAWFFPRLVGADANADLLVFALFFATAMAISALPVIVKTLVDLNLFKTDIGMVIVSSAILRDLIGWNIFAIILGMIGGTGGVGHVGRTILFTAAFVVFMLTIGRWLIDKVLPWVQAHTGWPGGVLGLALTGGLSCAALTEFIGIHAIFGAFIFGVALGNSSHLRPYTRTLLDQFISFIFAPIFFASIGLQVNFTAFFDLQLVLLVTAIGTIGMLGGCLLGARLSGFDTRESWAIGTMMNARGVMEIILGLLALQSGLISERLFVALVILALFTSLSSGSIMQAILKLKRPIRFIEHLSARRCVVDLRASGRRQAIAHLSRLACQGSDLDPERVFEAVWRREQAMSTGLDHGVAVPHARIEGLKAPVVAVGVSRTGVDFDAMDGMPAKLMFLVLTAPDDQRLLLHLLADIGSAFNDATLVERCSQVNNFTEFLALVKSHIGEGAG